MAGIQIADADLSWLHVLLLTIPVIYLITIWRALYGWLNLKDSGSVCKNSLPKISVIIAARNEEENLPKLLRQLNKQDYPHDMFEVIVVDDHSEIPLTTFLNKTEYSSLSLRICALDGTTQGKKEALYAGATISQNEMLLFTDADCIPGSSWISSIAACYQNETPELIIGLVDYLPGKRIIQKIFRLDFLSMVITGAGTAGNGNPTLCNGANLAVKRKTYLKHIKALKNELPSGDDIFLLQSVKNETKSRISILKNFDAIVYTAAPENLSQFFNQRQRWASKTRYYTDPFTLFLAALVVLTSISVVISGVLGITGTLTTGIALLPLVLKIMADYPLLAAGLNYFGKQKSLRWVVFFELIYPFYILLSALLSQFRGFSWKKREHSIITTQPQQSSL